MRAAGRRRAFDLYSRFTDQPSRAANIIR